MADKADATGVMLISRIVETLSGGRPGLFIGEVEKKKSRHPLQPDPRSDGKGGGI
jgi:hypothetical protein